MSPVKVPRDGLKVNCVYEPCAPKDPQVLRAVEIQLTPQAYKALLPKGRQGTLEVLLNKLPSFIFGDTKGPVFKVRCGDNIFHYHKPTGTVDLALAARADLKVAAKLPEQPSTVDDEDPAVKALQESTRRFEQEKVDRGNALVQGAKYEPIDGLDAQRKRPRGGAPRVVKKAQPKRTELGALLKKEHHRKGLFSGHQKGRPTETTTSLPVSPAMLPATSVPTTPYHPSPSANPVRTAEMIKNDCIKKVLLHVLAVRPVSEAYLLSKIRCTADELHPHLQKWARVHKPDQTKFELIDRGYKELDVGAFRYPDQDERQLVIERAIYAFDRLRFERDHWLWQMLLPAKERTRGKHAKCLTRLNLNLTPEERAKAIREAGTPDNRATPVSGSDKSDNEKKRKLDPADSAASGRSQSQGPIKKAKLSEKEAHSKSVLSKTKTKAAQSLKPKTTPAPQAKPVKDDDAEMKKTGA